MLQKLTKEEFSNVSSGWIYRTLYSKKKFKYIVYDNKTNIHWLSTFSKILAEKIDMKTNGTVSYIPMKLSVKKN